MKMRGVVENTGSCTRTSIEESDGEDDEEMEELDDDDFGLARWAFVLLFRNLQNEQQQRREQKRMEAAGIFWQIWQEQSVFQQIASEEVLHKRRRGQEFPEANAIALHTASPGAGGTPRTWGGPSGGPPAPGPPHRDCLSPDPLPLPRCCMALLPR